MQKLREVMTTVVVIGLSILLLNPMDVWMPTQAHMLLVAVLFIAVCVVAVLLWKQSAHDEREELHQLLQARVAYLATLGMLSTAIVVQSFTHSVDPWLVGTLAVMLCTRLVVAALLEKTR